MKREDATNARALDASGAEPPGEPGGGVLAPPVARVPEAGSQAASVDASAAAAGPAKASEPAEDGPAHDGQSDAHDAQAEAPKPRLAAEAEPQADDSRGDPGLIAYAANSIRTRLKRMLTYADGVRSGDDIEAVHDMRVWSRRTRAALEVFQSVFPAQEYAAVEREVKAITDSLSLARDLDVMIDSLGRRVQEMPPEQRAGLQSFIEMLQRRRSKAQAPVEKALKRLEQCDLEVQLDRMIRAAEPHPNVPGAVEQADA
jgi:hypothetical protein